MKPPQIMSTDLISVFDSTSTHEAFKIMKENKIRHLLVRDKSLRLVGIISDRDMIRAQNIYDSKKLDDNDDEPVSNYMTISVQSVDLQEDLSSALRIMLEKEISCIIVMDQNHPVGVITSYDAIQLLIQMLERGNMGVKPKVFDLVQKTADEVAVQLAKIGFF